MLDKYNINYFYAASRARYHFSHLVAGQRGADAYFSRVMFQAYIARAMRAMTRASMMAYRLLDIMYIAASRQRRASSRHQRMLLKREHARARARRAFSPSFPRAKLAIAFSPMFTSSAMRLQLFIATEKSGRQEAPFPSLPAYQISSPISTRITGRCF